MIKKQKDPGPFLEYKFIPDKRIERAALAALEETKLMPSSPTKVEIEKFCDRKWKFAEDYRDLGPDILGRATFSIKGLVSIEINESLDRDRSPTGVCRLRSTLAHEIGHPILQEQMFIDKIAFDQSQMSLFEEVERKQIQPAPTMIATRAKTIDSVRPPFEWWEYQANRFMAEILMPKPLFLQVVESRINREKVLAEKRGLRITFDVLNAEQDVVEAFQVSNQMAHIAVRRYLDQIRKEGERGLGLS